jgi:hypothetical protein
MEEEPVERNDRVTSIKPEIAAGDTTGCLAFVGCGCLSLLGTVVLLGLVLRFFLWVAGL